MWSLQGIPQRLKFELPECLNQILFCMLNAKAHVILLLTRPELSAGQQQASVRGEELAAALPLPVLFRPGS